MRAGLLTRRFRLAPLPRRTTWLTFRDAPLCRRRKLVAFCRNSLSRTRPELAHGTRPGSANRNTKALEERGLISPGKSRAPLTMVWHIKSKTKK